MSTTLSNLSVYLPFSSSKRNTSLKPTSVKFQPLRVKSMAAAAGGGEGRSNLDHLQQRANKPPQKRGTPQGNAPIGLWDRFPNARTIEQMMDTMESLMEDPLAYNNTWASSLPPKDDIGGGYRRGRTPWEIKEGESEYKMRFDMPGMTRNDVKVWLEDKMMVVRAEKVPKKKDGEEGVAAEEEEDEWSPKSYGKYKSRIALPDNIAFDKIKAEVKDGVLYINIPKASPTSKILDISVQ